MNLLVYIKPVIQYANAILMTIKEIMKALSLAKEQKDNIDYSEEFAGFGDSVGETTEQVEELENALNSLLGFDTLNILGNTNVSNIGVEGLQVEDKILDALKEYNMSLDKVNYKAKDVSEKILTWLGYTKELNEETGEWNWKLQDGFTNLEKIKASVLTIATTFATIKISNGLKTLLMGSEESVGLIGSLKKIPKLLSPTTLIITAIVGLLAYMYASNEDFRESINGLLKSLGSVLIPIINIIVDVIKQLMPIINMLIDEIVIILVPIIEALIPIIQLIAQIIKSLAPIISGALGLIVQVLAKVLSAVLPLINVIIAIAEALVQVVGGAIQFVLGLVDGIVNAVYGVLNTLGDTLKAVFETIVALFSGNTDKIREIWGNLGEKLKGIWGNIWKSIKTTFIGIINSIITVFAKMVNLFTKQINKLTSNLSEVWDWTGIPPIPPIPEWTPNLIPLASGGVITKPTPALVGEYSGAKNNPEIVTPENLMRKVFAESMLPIAQAIINGNQGVIGAIDGLSNRPIELNGRKVSENLYDDFNKVVLRKTGKSLGYVK